MNVQQTLSSMVDGHAAARLHGLAVKESAWLHEEVARRMMARLDYFKKPPQSWVDWRPVSGGLSAHQALRGRWAGASCWVYETHVAARRLALECIGPRWIDRLPWRPGTVQVVDRMQTSVDLIWANLQLHRDADPRSLLGHWRDILSPDGVLMFSTWGPDTLLELRDLYAALGWPPPCQPWLDMHDLGDMALKSGFKDPVMDVERIVLTFSSPERLLQELRSMGRNLHPQRFDALRGRNWRRRLDTELAARPLKLTFELVYGCAWGGTSEGRGAPEPASIPLAQVRQALQTRGHSATTATVGR